MAGSFIKLFRGNQEESEVMNQSFRDLSLTSMNRKNDRLIKAGKHFTAPVF
jgi:hypothetical protein